MLPTDSPKEGENLPYFLASSSSEEWHLLDQNERRQPSESDNDGGGFDDLMSRLQAAMKTNSADIAVPKRAVLESQLKTNPYFDALRSVLEEEKQRDEKRKIDLKELKCLANSLTNLIGQQLEETPAQEAKEGNANGGEESGEDDGKRMGTAVERKMAEYAAFCHFDSNEGKAKKEEAEEEHCPIRAKMRECLRKSQQIEQQIEENTEICVGRARNLLGLQARLRPISEEDVAQFESVIQLSAQLWREELRDAVCSHLLLLKALGASERKKRQNFSVQTIGLLNHYFMQHLDQPYPDEQTKLALAEQCGITLAQVSNWFGNKRIRFRKAAQQKRLKESLEAEEEKQLGEEEEEEVDDNTAGQCREGHGKKAKNCK